MSDTDDLPRGLALTSLAPDFRADPFAILAALRSECPVFHDGQLRDHVVFDAGRVAKVLADRELLVDPRNLQPSSTRMLRGEDLTAEPHLLHSDGDRHRRLRSLMMKALSKSRLDAFRPRTGEICAALLDRVADGDFDFVQAVARPMPTIVITELLGIDESRHEDFKRWSDEIVAFTLNPLSDDETKRVGAEALAASDEMMTGVVQQRLDTGDRPDDLISAMMDARTVDGERLSTGEIVQQAQLLLIAGNQTTTDLMGTMMRNLLESGSFAALVDDPALIPNAIEECLRFEPPIFGTERITAGEYRIDGETVPKGHTVTAMLTAANRDPAVNDDPDRFDITRKNLRHFAFGGGAHRCLGAPLAKMEAEVLLEQMTARWPGLRLGDDAPVYSSSPAFRGLESLGLRTG